MHSGVALWARHAPEDRTGRKCHLRRQGHLPWGEGGVSRRWWDGTGGQVLPLGGTPAGWGGRACSRLPAAGRPASLALMGASEPPCARTTFVPSPTSLRRALLSVPAPPTPVLDCPRPPCLGAAAKPGASGRAVGLAVGSGGGTCARGPRPGQPWCTGDLGSARRGKRWAGARSRGRGAKPPPPPARRRASRASEPPCGPRGGRYLVSATLCSSGAPSHVSPPRVSQPRPRRQRQGCQRGNCNLLRLPLESHLPPSGSPGRRERWARLALALA